MFKYILELGEHGHLHLDPMQRHSSVRGHLIGGPLLQKVSRDSQWKRIYFDDQ